MTQIYTGTADAVNGSSTVVINTGDPLSASIVREGSLVFLDGAGYFAVSLVDTSTFEIERDYAGTTGTVPVSIWPIDQATGDAAEVFRIVREQRDRINAYDRNAQGLFYAAIGVTGAADPGPGNLAFDNADPEAATEVYVDYLDANSNHRNVSPLFARFRPGDTIRLRSLATTAFYEFRLTGVTDSSGYYTFAVDFIASDGIIGSEPVALSWVPGGEGLYYDAAGTFAGRDAYDDEWLNDEGKPFSYLSSNGDGDALTGTVLFVKASSSSGDWQDGFPLSGPQGNRGWSPVFSIVDRSGGVEAVVRLTDWVGGEGAKPTAGVGQYVAPGGLTSNINSAYNVRGQKGDSYGTPLIWQTATTDVNPTSGRMRANSADFASITWLYINSTDAAGFNLDALLGRIGSVANSTERGTVQVLAANNPAVYAEFAVTGPAVAATGYWKIPVAPLAGAVLSPNGLNVVLSFNAAGNDGLDGTDPGVLMSWDAGTSDADPGAGRVRANNAALGSAALLYVSKANRVGDELDAFVAGLGASSNSRKGQLLVTRTSDGHQAGFSVTGITDATGYVKVAVEGHFGVTGLNADDHVSLQFTRDGDQGSADLTSVANAITTAPEKTDPVGDDEWVIGDSQDGGAGKRVKLARSRRAIGTLASGSEIRSANSTLVAADVGKTLLLNAAAPRTLTLAAATALGADFSVVLDNIGTADWTIEPDGAETINGESSLTVVPGDGFVLQSDGGGLRSVLRGGAGSVRYDREMALSARQARTARLNIGVDVFNPNVAERDYILSKPWLSGVSAADNAWMSIAYSPKLNLYVKVSANGTNRLAISKDGRRSWTLISVPAGTWYKVRWIEALERFFVIGANGTSSVLWSDDGETWNVSTTPEGTWTDLVYMTHRSRLIATCRGNLSTMDNAGQAMVSDDGGETWALKTLPVNNDWLGLAYSDDLETVIIFGSPMVDSVNLTPYVLRSSDGDTFVAEEIGNTDHWWNGIWVSELGRFVLVANNYTQNKIMISFDGVAFDTILAPSNDNWYDVVWARWLGLLVAVSTSGAVMYSINGDDWFLWSPSTGVGSSQNWRGLVAVEEHKQIVCVGTSGTGNRVMATAPLVPITASNDNGEYTLFPDGRVIATRNVNVDLSSSAAQSFALPVSMNTGSPIAMAWNTVTGFAGGDITAFQTAWIYRSGQNWIWRCNGGGATSSYGVTLQATGRWF